MKEGQAAKAIYRKDYTPFPWAVEQFDLRFAIGDEFTEVRAAMELRKRSADEGLHDLDLAGKDLELVSIRLDGEELPADRFSISGENMLITGLPARCRLDTVVRIRPAGFDPAATIR